MRMVIPNRESSGQASSARSIGPQYRAVNKPHSLLIADLTKSLSHRLNEQDEGTFPTRLRITCSSEANIAGVGYVQQWQ